jgi:hypothetical protein
MDIYSKVLKFLQKITINNIRCYKSEQMRFKTLPTSPID